MTSKQKANIIKFKKVVAEAKKLRSKDPKLTQGQAVKKAWAMLYPKPKKVAGSHKDTKSHNVNIRVVSGWKKGSTAFREKTEKKVKGKKNVRVHRYPKGSLYGGGRFANFTAIRGIMSELATGTKVSKLAKQYLIDNIDLSGYDYPVQINDVGKVKILHDIFNQEYGWAINRYGKVKAIKEWLMGLPSAINIDFYNDDIIKLAQSWGTLSMNPTEKQINKILGNYWNLMANNLNQLFEKVKNKNIIYNK